MISVALFLLLDASVLILNFYISFEIADDALGVNLAGRQRMLSQRMVKSLLELDHVQSLDNADNLVTAAAAELRSTRNLFDQTLNAFTNGGPAKGADGEAVVLAAAQTADSRAALAEAARLWRPYRDHIDAVLSDVAAADRGEAPAALAQAIVYGRANNLRLLTLMNDLTVDLERVATSKATRLRMIQTVGISLAVFNFLFILLHFVRQLRDSDQRIEAARKETSDILATVGEGLFLLDQDLMIGSQYSEHLLEIFGRRTIAGTSFDQLLKDMISEKDLATAHGFVRLLFNERVKEKLIGDLNPLNCIQVNIVGDGGAYTTKYLQFDFSRVSVDQSILHILVTVKDISDSVKLARELEISKARGEQQLELLTSILHANTDLLHRFIDNAFRCFNTVNQLLKQPVKDASGLRAKVNSLFVEVHNFKGEAAALKLDAFEAQAHEFENEIAALRDKPTLQGNDFLGLAVRLDKLISYTQAVQQLTVKLAKLGRAESRPAAAADDWAHLHALADSVAKRQGKHVNLVVSGLAEQALDEQTRQLLNELCIQFIRNAIVHGLETPAVRRESQKNARGRIDIRLAQLAGGELELSVSDDGQGFDYQAIRARALELGHWGESELDSWDNKRLLSLIFEPGFSTAGKLDKDGGRGVGMDVIMRRVQASRGRIRLACRRGQYCRFDVTLPAPATAQEAA